jgi:hypothetical protein
MSNTHVENMQRQIDRLESLVTSLMSHKNGGEELGRSCDSVSTQDSSPNGCATQISPALTADATDAAGTADAPKAEKVKSGQGMLKIDNDHSVYVGPSHWSDVLHEVRLSCDAVNSSLTEQLNALKISFTLVQEEQYELALSASFASTTIDGPSFLCGIVSPIEIPELLASLPAKYVADKLIARFFDDDDFLVPSLRKNFVYDIGVSYELMIYRRRLAQAHISKTGEYPCGVGNLIMG